MVVVNIAVVGGGHAGIEASLISARLGHKVALITLDKNKIGQMNCGPDVGAPAKGIVVREIDALGGEMGKAADATALQFKLLGRGTTQALRVQSDKIAYSRYMQKVVSEQENLTIIEGAVDNLLIKKGKIEGVKLKNGEIIHASIVILTTGTYLQPVTYQGQSTKIEGPEGEKKVVNNLSKQLKELGFRIKRFSTGTSPRLLRNSIDYSSYKLEPGTNLPLRFSHQSNISDLLPFSKQLPCYLLHTNEKTHQIIRDSLHLSSSIKDTAPSPLNCPGIEDKVSLFTDVKRHQIFLEPESRELDTTYVQGLATSLPVEVQIQILKSLPGFENVQVKRWGYDISYDLIDSTQLKISLESKLVDGLFTAGQINGTTGYEEAAAQGLMAGINASRKLKNQTPLILKRSEAYIGVLIDDLVLAKEEITDPYRLFPSRAEYRLLLRHDNADTRLYPINREQLGLLSEEQWKKFQQKQELQKSITQKLRELKFSREDLNRNFSWLDITQWKKIQKISAYELLTKNNEFPITKFSSWITEIKDLDWEAQRELEVNIKHAGYIKNQEQLANKMKEHENTLLPENIDYDQVPNLSLEEKEKLKRFKPATLAQAGKIAGVNPTGLQVLLSLTLNNR